MIQASGRGLIEAGKSEYIRSQLCNFVNPTRVLDLRHKIASCESSEMIPGFWAHFLFQVRICTFRTDDQPHIHPYSLRIDLAH